MTQAGCSPWGRESKFLRDYGARYRQSIRTVNYILIVALSLLLCGHVPRAMAALQEPTKSFHTFHLHSMARGQHYPYSQSQWKDLQKNGAEKLPWSNSSSRAFGNGSIALTLVHRDARDSPFRASSNVQANGVEQETDFTMTLRKALHRDAARVRAIESVIKITKERPTKKTTTTVPSSRVHSVPGPPLESPVVSGLDFGSGEYFTTLSFGSPDPVEVLVTVDTGSDLVWLQCHPCDSCYDQIGPIFNPGASDSYEAVPCYSRACDALPESDCYGSSCQYTEKYGDGSYSTGEFATETITMNSTRGRPFAIQGFLFGCGHDNEGLFTASAGLLGLGRGHLSFPSQIASVLAPRFSYCLTDRFLPRDDGGDGGDGDGEATATTATSYLFFGESESSSESMKYTDLLRNPFAPTFYYLHLTGISVAKELVEIPASALDLDMSSGRGGVILDTGTAVTRLANDAYLAMRDAFRVKGKHLKRLVVPNQELFDTCFQLEEGQAVPILTLHFAGDVDLALPLDNSVIPVDDSGTVYCLAFAPSDPRVDLTIIGNVQQQGFRFEFDLGKGKVGFTQQDCSS